MADLISGYDLYLFHQGNHFHSYRMLGAHPFTCSGEEGIRFSVWAPHAREVYVVGDFNNWQGRRNPLQRLKDSGVWAAFVAEAREGQLYKFEVHSRDGRVFLKSDPYAFAAETRPATASRISLLKEYPWQDGEWQARKAAVPSYNRPMLVYEVHAGSWRRHGDGTFYGYRRLADELADYAADLGYTHVELLPLAEHPLDASWGYQATGYYAATSRYGRPEDLQYFVDRCHQRGIGVILDWVPGHFCRDAHGLAAFDGSPLFEYDDPLRADNKGWGTLNFDLGKPEILSFLISNAVFWLDTYHIDGLRVDAVASILYLDYGRGEGEWRPNRYGGRENLEGIGFFKKLNQVVFKYFPQALMMAEESTAWPLVSEPTYLGGLGFNYKWNMGWMNDTLQYVREDPSHRRHHHNLLTFSLTYAFSENFILPLSHDEVVHGKRSLIGKMPGDYWQKFAGLRLLFAYLMTHPGKKLLFMGGELGQFSEWSEDKALDWNLLDYPMHRQLHRFVRDLQHFYLRERSLWELDRRPEGFAWIEPAARDQSIFIYLRNGTKREEFLTVLLNFTPLVHENYRLGLPREGHYREVFNSDREEYGGSGRVNQDLRAEPVPWQGQPYSGIVAVPPLAAVIFKLTKKGGKA
jgi:1,4-alpha-glucan branching enzyme